MLFSDSVASKIIGTSTKKHSDLLKHMSYLNLWQRHQGTDELVAVEDDGVKNLEQMTA